MGLDMYLYATYGVPAYHSEGSTLEERYEAYKKPAIKSKRLEKVRQACGLPPSLPVEYEDFNWFDIQFPIAKWRKENAIHNWFIQNCAPKNKKTGQCDTFVLTRSSNFKMLKNVEYWKLLKSVKCFTQTSPKMKKKD